MRYQEAHVSSPERRQPLQNPAQEIDYLQSNQSWQQGYNLWSLRHFSGLFFFFFLIDMRCKRKISVVTWMHLSTILWVRPSDFFLALLILLKKPDEVNTFGFPLSHSQHRSSPGSKIQATASLLSYPVQHRVRQEPAPSALNSRAPSTGKRTFIPQKC